MSKTTNKDRIEILKKLVQKTEERLRRDDYERGSSERFDDFDALDALKWAVKIAEESEVSG